MANSQHTAFHSLPIVDVGGLTSSQPEVRRRVADELGRAAREVGFLYVTGNGVDPQLSRRLMARAEAYFAQPLADKMRHYIGHSCNHSGYVPEGEEQFAGATRDSKEAYDIGFDYLADAGRKPMLGPNQWPDMPGFKTDVLAYYQAVFALSRRLFAGFALALGLPENRFTDWVKHPPSQLRLLHYPGPGPQSGPARPGIGAHTDYECFTILLPTAPGLEVLNGAGDWIEVPLVDGAFIINIGDMLEVLSNGRFVATSHRVSAVTEERYSFPLFCACDYDTLIAPLPELLGDDAPSRYTPLSCGDHLYAQTIQTFTYLKNRLARGDIALPDGAKHLASFGYGAKQETRP